MNRTELIVVTAIVLLIAFAFGWLFCWIFNKFNRVNSSNVAELDQLASSLHDTEEQRDQAFAYMEQRENELTNELGQAHAELEAAMSGLGEARREAEELRAYIEQSNLA